MGDRRGAYRFSVGRPEVRRPLKRPRGKNGWIILKWIFKTWDGDVWTTVMWLR
jgi:hypothetical protein